MSAPLIEVVGSLNIDLVTTTPRVPGAGETVAASSFSTGFGGKGANQAVACARLLRAQRASDAPDGGVEVRMLGAVGDDQFGTDMCRALERDGLVIDGIAVRAGEKTGTAVIIVEEQSGENRILFCAGANGSLRPEHVWLRRVEGGVALFQLETPLETVIASIHRAKELGRIVVLNPAPAAPLPRELYAQVDCLIMNESEAALLAGVSEDELMRSLDAASSFFLGLGVTCVVITLGSKGAYHRTQDDTNPYRPSIYMPPVPVAQVVDTTAAGDTFVGAFAMHLARSRHARDATTRRVTPRGADEAVAFATRAASCTVQKAGAQASIPFRAELPSPGDEVLDRWRAEPYTPNVLPR